MGSFLQNDFFDDEEKGKIQLCEVFMLALTPKYIHSRASELIKRQWLVL